MKIPAGTAVPAVMIVKTNQMKKKSTTSPIKKVAFGSKNVLMLLVYAFMSSEAIGL